MKFTEEDAMRDIVREEIMSIFKIKVLCPFCNSFKVKELGLDPPRIQYKCYSCGSYFVDTF